MATKFVARAVIAWLVGMAAAVAAAGQSPAETQTVPATATSDESGDEVGEEVVTLESLIATSSKNRKAPSQRTVSWSDAKLAKYAAAHLDQSDYFGSPELRQWRAAVRRDIGKGDLRGLAQRLSGQFADVPAEPMHALLRDWLIATAESSDYELEDDRTGKSRAFAEATIGHALAGGAGPLAIEIAAAALEEGFECDDPVFGELADRAGGRDAWLWIATASGCTTAQRQAVLHATKPVAAAVIAQTGGELRGYHAAPLALWLLEPVNLATVDAAYQGQVRTWLLREAMGDMLEAGLNEPALAVWDTLDPASRAALLGPRPAAFAAHVEGVGVYITPGDFDRLPLAAALASAGRGSELPLPDGKAEWRLVDCLFAQVGAPEKDAADDENPPREICGVAPNALDQAVLRAVNALRIKERLEPSGRDMYPLFEVEFAHVRMYQPNGAITRGVCPLADARFSTACRATLDTAASVLEPLARTGYDADKALLADALAARLSGYGPVAAMIETARGKTLAILAAQPGEAALAWADRPAVEPDPIPFTVSARPAAIPAAKAAAADEPVLPKGAAPLPREFALVRFARSGARAVAVSQSSRYDQAGEVGAGGYWVHISENGGHSWQAPLYTGLTAMFPYRVMPTSQVPILDGETLRLEVEEALLDTRSITYPPVGLQFLRRKAGLVVDIPLAALRADGDGDGVSDVIAHHLLLDREGPERPFLVGSDISGCAVEDRAAARLKGAFLARLIGGRQDAALIEPVGRIELSSGWSRLASAESGPLFLKGDGADFRCIAPAMTMLVYNDAGEAALQRKVPDFRLLSAPAFVMNRDGTRGITTWSMGWTGGTTVAMLVAGEWKFVEVSSWIT